MKPIEAKLLHNSLLSSNLMIRGLSSATKSVHPECAILYPEVRSDIGVISDNVMLENRSDVDNLRIIRLNQVESGNDANFEVDKQKDVCL